MRTYVRSIAERLDEGRGIWFTGDVGTGKTTLAMLVSKAAMEADRTVAIYSLPRLLALLRDIVQRRRAVLAQRARSTGCASVDLLHIDDVGAEQSSPWVLEQLYTIVNTRYEDGKALLLTTNLDHEALEEQIGAAHRLADLRDLRRAAAHVGRRPAHPAADAGRGAGGADDGRLLGGRRRRRRRTAAAP